MSLRRQLLDVSDDLLDAGDGGVRGCVLQAASWLASPAVSAVLLVLLGLSCCANIARRRPSKGCWFFPPILETSFDAMIPTTQPALVTDPELPAYLFACVPVRQLPPSGRGAPLASDGGNGDFMKLAVKSARTFVARRGV